MRVAKDSQICGLPAPLARDLMRRLGPLPKHVAVAVSTLNADEAETLMLLASFEKAGYLRQIANETDSEWVTTTRGNALAQASFGKPITRATAEKHLSAVLDRTRAYNSDPDKLLAIAQVSVFGSYLDPTIDALGDLDINITILRRITQDDYMERTLAYANASGRRFNDMIERMTWPQRELTLLLKNRSTAISITSEDLAQLTERSHNVYRIEDDPDAIQPPADAMIQR